MSLPLTKTALPVIHMVTVSTRPRRLGAFTFIVGNSVGNESSNSEGIRWAVGVLVIGSLYCLFVCVLM